MPKNSKIAKGDIVYYTHKVDTVPGETPNYSPAMVTKVHPEVISGSTEAVELTVFHSEGYFYIHKVLPTQNPGERGFYYWP